MKNLFKFSFSLAIVACAFFNVNAFNEDNLTHANTSYGQSGTKALAGNAGGTKFCCTSGTEGCGASTDCKVNSVPDVV